MKKFLAFILILALTVLPIISCGGTTEDESEKNTETPIESESLEGDEELYVGYARASLDPVDENGNIMPNIYLAGYDENRLADRIRFNLFASCTALRDKDGDIALIYTLDLHSMSQKFATNTAKILSKELGIPEENIILSVTHTHSAPHVRDDAYKTLINDRILAAGREAIADLALVTKLYAGNIHVPQMNFIRRYINDENGNPKAHESDIDDRLPVVRFVREGKKEVILSNWACHPATTKTDYPTSVSSDYVGPLREAIESELDAYFSLQMGAAGDIAPSSKLITDAKFKGTSNYGKALADKLIEGLPTLERLVIKSDIKALTSGVRLSYDHSSDAKKGEADEIMKLYNDAGKKLTDAVKAKLEEYNIASIYEANYIIDRAENGVYGRLYVSALSIGNVVFAVAPYEMSCQTGVRVKESADEFDFVFMCAYSNGMMGYIPNDEAFDNGGYEVYSCIYERGSAELLQNEIIRLIDELAK